VKLFVAINKLLNLLWVADLVVEFMQKLIRQLASLLLKNIELVCQHGLWYSVHDLFWVSSIENMPNRFLQRICL